MDASELESFYHRLMEEPDAVSKDESDNEIEEIGKGGPEDDRTGN